MRDNRLRDCAFNPIDDYALAVPSASPTEAGLHRYITLYDRLVIAATADGRCASDAHHCAIAALKRRAKAFGIEAKGGA